MSIVNGKLPIKVTVAFSAGSGTVDLSTLAPLGTSI
jgi:hypothetical protein